MYILHLFVLFLNLNCLFPPIFELCRLFHMRWFGRMNRENQFLDHLQWILLVEMVFTCFINGYFPSKVLPKASLHYILFWAFLFVPWHKIVCNMCQITWIRLVSCSNLLFGGWACACTQFRRSCRMEGKSSNFKSCNKVNVFTDVCQLWTLLSSFFIVPSFSKC